MMLGQDPNPALLHPHFQRSRKPRGRVHPRTKRSTQVPCRSEMHCRLVTPSSQSCCQGMTCSIQAADLGGTANLGGTITCHAQAAAAKTALAPLIHFCHCNPHFHNRRGLHESGPFAKWNQAVFDGDYGEQKHFPSPMDTIFSCYASHVLRCWALSSPDYKGDQRTVA